MMKQAFFYPLAAAGVGAAFVAVGGLVWLSRGRNARLVRAKLALGGLLLTLGVGGSACGDGSVTCYAPPPDNYVEIASHTVYVRVDPFVRGEIYYPRETSYSFVVTSTGPQGTEVARGPVVADDGSFDQSRESFHIRLPNGLASGPYRLELYAVRATTSTLVSTYALEIVNA